jgi:tRNA dimethylallyltransferase
MRPQLLCIVGPTASGKSARGIEEALTRGGEIISVDSRQIYRGLDIGTEKLAPEQRQGVPHHLIDIRDVTEGYSAAEFVEDAARLIDEIRARGKLPILVGGTHFYFDALLHPLPTSARPNYALREELAGHTNDELYSTIEEKDPRRAAMLDRHNRRRLVRALEIIDAYGQVPLRDTTTSPYEVEWIIIDPPREELRPRIDARLTEAFARGLVDEVRGVADKVSVEALNELGLEYRIVGEYLRGERGEASILPTLSAKLWQYARRQKAWLRKLSTEHLIAVTPLPQDRS